ncbi:hypothetical protein LWM68_14265 [Niabella sp. W65]|nr:hypothetical protein [Niabella sp. W65]MCH7363811.1 hypothetical protein [Niabella sp. W65]
MYVVAPIPHKKSATILNSLPKDKFLMIDRYLPLAGDVSYITQEFSSPPMRHLPNWRPQSKGLKNAVLSPA